MLAAETRQAAVEALLGLLQTDPAAARIDPTRTLVQTNRQLWTIVAMTSPAPPTEPPSALRRAGAKHRRVR